MNLSHGKKVQGKVKAANSRAAVSLYCFVHKVNNGGACALLDHECSPASSTPATLPPEMFNIVKADPIKKRNTPPGPLSVKRKPPCSKMNDRYRKKQG